MEDLPPSYHEVVNNPRIQRNQPSTTPSAPRLDAIITSPDLGHAQGEQSSRGTTYPYVQNDGRFSAWNHTATEMLIMNCLELNERFEKAQNQQERDKLWDIILNQFLAAGYSFARIDLIQYWEYQFYIYKSIVNDLSAGTQSNPNWKYFETMDAVFKYSTEVPNLNSLGQGNYTAVDSSPATNTFGGLAKLESNRDVLLPEPISVAYNGIPSDPVITSQPTPRVNIPAENHATYVPIAPSRQREDDDDCCCCCIGCCDDSPRGYSGRTGGYTSHDNYNTFSHSDGYNGADTSDYYYHTSGFSNDDNRDNGCDSGGGDDGGYDTGGGGATDDGCCDSGGGGDDGCCDSGGGGDDGCCDTGGGGDDGCCDSGGGGCDD